VSGYASRADQLSRHIRNLVLNGDEDGEFEVLDEAETKIIMNRNLGGF